MSNRKKIYNIGHKGASAYYPENTFLSFEKALEMGADMIEVDLRLTGDKEVVVIHDSHVMLSGGNYVPVAELEFEEIKKIELDMNQKIPAFKELVKKVKDRCMFYIDLKENEALDYVIEILREEKCISSGILGSKDSNLLNKSYMIDKDLKRSMLISLEDKDKTFILSKKAEIDFIHPCWEKFPGSPSSLLDESFFRKASDMGCGIITWHEEREDELEALTSLPVSGICTDCPDRLSKILKR